MSITENTALADGSTTSLGEDHLQVVTFEVNGEEFAVDILAVHEINRMMELTRVPQSPPEVVGVINLRGKIIPVVDLRSRFMMPPGEQTDHNRIIVVEIRNRVIGFVVDRVHEVLRVPGSIVDTAPQMVTSIDTDFIRGVGKLNERLLILLDLPKLFHADELDEFGQVG